MGFHDSYFTKPEREKQNEPTRFLYFGGIGEMLCSDVVEMRSILCKFGSLDSNAFVSTPSSNFDGLYMPKGKRYCFAAFEDVDSAKRAFQFFTLNCDISELNVKNLDVKFSHLATNKNELPQSTSETENIVIPGLCLIENFVDDDLQAKLLEDLSSEAAPWKVSLSRRVQHYGYSFSYRTLMVDFTKPTPEFPEELKSLASNINFAYKSISNEETLPFNQMTINEYMPGQGISAHIDTNSCFGPVLCILSLNSGIVMNMSKSEPSEKKRIFLPAKSLLILYGDARYQWNHGISQRKFDNVEGKMTARDRRISFTFRQVVRPGPIPSTQLISGDIEKDHVVKVYDAIAVHWNHTRGKRKVHWHRVKDFVDSLPPGSLIADVGSGDGKYFGVNPDIISIGCDRSLRLLEVSHEDGHETFACDAVTLPFISNSFDATMCIAVLHHLASVDRRFAVISELVRITHAGGTIFIQAWALEQGEGSKRSFDKQDQMVPWKLNKRFMEAESKPLSNDQDDIIVYERYCHVYREGELEELCSRVPFCKIVNSGWDRGNWFVELIKLDDTILKLPENSVESAIPNFSPRSPLLE